MRVGPATPQRGKEATGSYWFQKTPATARTILACWTDIAQPVHLGPPEHAPKASREKNPNAALLRQLLDIPQAEAELRIPGHEGAVLGSLTGNLVFSISYHAAVVKDRLLGARLAGRYFLQSALVRTGSEKGYPNSEKPTSR